MHVLHEERVPTESIHMENAPSLPADHTCGYSCSCQCHRVRCKLYVDAEWRVDEVAEFGVCIQLRHTESDKTGCRCGAVKTKTP